MPDHTGPTFYMHIGLPKTATSWLQAEVFSRLDHLLYLDSPRSTLFEGEQDNAEENRMLASAMRRSSRLWKEYGGDIFREMLGDKAVWRRGMRDVLVSEERIGRQGSRPELLAAHLREFAATARDRGFERVCVLYFVRRQDRWLASHYAQVSDRNPKAGQKDFERLVREVVSPRHQRFGFGTLLDYDALHGALVGAVGPGNVRAFVHEDLQEDQQGVLDGLLSCLGTPDARIGTLAGQVAGTTTNVRSAQDEWRLRPQCGRLARLRRLWTRQGGVGTISLAPRLSSRVLSAYARSNENFASATGLELVRHGYLPAYGRPSRRPAAAEDAERIGEMRAS